MTNHTTPKTCGYTTSKNGCFQKLCRRSTVVTSDRRAHTEENVGTI